MTTDCNCHEVGDRSIMCGEHFLAMLDELDGHPQPNDALREAARAPRRFTGDGE